MRSSHNYEGFLYALKIIIRELSHEHSSLHYFEDGEHFKLGIETGKCLLDFIIIIMFFYIDLEVMGGN